MILTEVRGGDDVDALMRRIRTHADAKAIRKELYSGLNRVSKRVREEMKDSTNQPPVLPTAGGLQARAYAKQSVTAGVKGGKWAGVSIRVRGRKGGMDIGSVHRTGRLRHPVFGNRKVWVTQDAGVQAKWMDPVFEDQKPDVVRALSQVMDDIARRVEG